MGKCTKMRCPMQVGTVDENCDIKDCPYRTDSDVVAKWLYEGLAKYFENTIEITKKIRLPKGDTCDFCDFKKHANTTHIDSDCSCAVGGGVYCALYGERLKLKGDFLNSPMCAVIPPERCTYCKCEQCKIDTGEKL